MANKSVHSVSTEDKILEAAKEVFLRRGLDGATMQQIADEAKINKSLLHYYFRTKQKLFGTVLKYALKFVIPQLQDILDSNETIFVKIEKLVSGYINLLRKNSLIPAFILSEINRDPDGIVQIILGAGIKPAVFIGQINEEIRKGSIRPVDPKHLIINMLSLCVFPIVARPLAQRIFFENNEKAYQQFLHEREKAVADFIIHSIKV